MPKLGRVEQGSVNKFKNIGLQKSRPSQKKGSNDIGDALNKLAGNGEDGVKFVDRNSHNKLGKDGFLKLLTHQLANQDPTNPVDQKKFASELASISQLEQLTNMNSKLDKLSPNAATESKFFAASFLGKEVQTNGTSLSYDGVGSKNSIPFKLEKDTSKVIVRLRDEKAQMVRQIELENISSGNHEINWDGKGADKLPATKGRYHVEVLAFDKSGMPFTGKTQTFGKVTGVNYEEGELVLTLNGKEKVFMRDVENFRLPQDQINGHNALKNERENLSVLSNQLKGKVNSLYGKQQD